ncbi:MAG TPA: cyclic nucleotide-binding domain-containing protein [Cyclobacteriaceae bacterium]
MVQAFLKFLGGIEGEEKPMLLLLGKGFFMGIFLATYQIGSETLFLNTMGESYLDVAFFTTGFLGIVSTILYVSLQKRLKYSVLVTSNIFLILLFITGIRLSFEFIDYSVSENDFYILPFVLFVMIGPITAVTLLGFWGLFGRIFDLRQSKRIIGGIDTGQLSATILAFFSIPILTTYVIDKTYDLLMFSSLAAFGVFIFSITIIRNYNVDAVTKRQKGEMEQTIRFIDILKTPYLKMLSLFLVFSMGVSVFVSYTFLTATETMYPNETELANFLSFFNGAIMISSFLIQSFINDYIIENYGLKIALMVMPLVLILFTIGAVVSGHIFGYEEKSDVFLFYFLFTALGKLFTASLKDALENPAFKLFFLPLDVKIRFDVQTKIEGVVNQFSTLIAGAAQIGLGLLVFFELIHFSYFILGLAILVVIYATKLFNEYKTTLRGTLEVKKDEMRGEGKRNVHSTINVLKNELLEEETDRSIISLKLLERIEPIKLEDTLIEMLQTELPVVRKYSYVKLNECKPLHLLESLKEEVSYENIDRLKQLGNKVIDNFEKFKKVKISEERILPMIRSANFKDRILAARLLVNLEEDRHVSYVNELMRDINPEVKKAAMLTAGKLKRPELWPILIENLDIPAYSNVAMASLIASGDSVLQTVDNAFYKTNQSPNVMLRIIQVIGRLGGSKAIELLWRKIDYPDKSIISEILLSLSYNGFQAYDFQAARIKIAIEAIIGDIAWNIKALTEIPNDDHYDYMVRNAFEEENKQNYRDIFMLLAMIYDPQSIRLVQENIEEGSTDNVAFAIEMLQVFVEDNLKVKLFPILDDYKNSERLNKLQAYYPPEEFENYQDLLLQIINRDYNHINKWTKALAMYKIGSMPDAKVADALVANLFNPDYFMRETAAAIIYMIDQHQYDAHTARLDPKVKSDLDKAILPPVFQEEGGKFHKKLLNIENTMLLKEIDEFKSIPGAILIELAKVTDEIKIDEGITIIDKEDKGVYPIFIIVKGSIRLHDEDQTIKTLLERSVIGEEVILDSDKYNFSATTEEESLLLIISKDEFYDMMSKYIDMVDVTLRVLNSELKTEEHHIEI